MDRFIICENIRHFETLLSRDLEAGERERVLAMLAEEKEKLRALIDVSPPAARSHP